MIPLVLSPEEVRAALAGKLTEIRRLVEPQPDGVFPGVGPCRNDQEKADRVNAGCFLGGYYTPIACPFGSANDLLFGQETWAAHWMYDDVPAAEARSTHPGDNRWYEADGDDAAGSCGCPAAGRRGRWRDASTLLEQDSRLAFRNRGVRVEKVDGVWCWVVAVERVAEESRS